MKRTKHTKELRKVEVQKLVEKGLTQREISEKLSVSLKTINWDCQEIKFEAEKKTKLSLLDQDLRRVEELGLVDYLYNGKLNNMVMQGEGVGLTRIKCLVFAELERRIEIIPTADLVKLASDIAKLPRRKLDEF